MIQLGGVKHSSFFEDKLFTVLQ